MEFNKHPPEYTPLPRELALHPERELAPPPPEFGQGTGPSVEAARPKRRLQQFLAIPAVLLVSFLCLHGAKSAPVTPVPDEPAPAETAEPVPEKPRGDVVLDVLYAVRDGNTARYCYTVYTPTPSLDATQEQIDAYKGTPWPISVYARVSDQAGHLVAPTKDPDIWDSSRSAFEYSLDVTGLEGDLTLTLTALYTQEGEERQSQAVLTLPTLPPAPETGATLELLGSGGILYSAYFNPQPEDTHTYHFQATSFSFVWFDSEGNECDEAPVWEWDTLPSLNGNSGVSDKAIAAAYEGPAWIERPSDEAVRLCARLILTDETTGYPYVIDSNRIDLATDPIMTGWLEVEPGGHAEAVFRFVPAPNDPGEYDMHVVSMAQIVHGDDEMDGIGGFSLVDDPRAIPVTGDRENGYTVTYSGGSAAASIPDGARLSLYLQLENRITGELYSIETNQVDKVERVVPYETYPLEDGEITITVYNDTPDFVIPTTVETDTGLTVLAVETFSAAEFTDYGLPSAWTPDGYDFAGWVVHVNNPMDMSSGTNLFMEYEGDPPPEALLGGDSFVFELSGIIDRDVVERVPPSEDGVRYVNVHAVWIAQNPEEELILLDDGLGNVTGYGMESPIASEGYLYLCNYPIPYAPGPDMEFDGWYDATGNRVDMLVSYFSFVPVLRAPDGSFLGYDWSGDYEPVRLTAHWKRR